MADRVLRSILVSEELMAARRKRDLMTATKALARGHPLMLFFVLAFAFSWVAWAPAAFLSGDDSQPRTLAPLLHLLGGLGPMLSAFVVTALAGGSVGLRELLGRVFRWRVGLGWWGVALLGTPVLFLLAAVRAGVCPHPRPLLGRGAHAAVLMRDGLGGHGPRGDRLLVVLDRDRLDL